MLLATDVLFTNAWRQLSFQATGWMIPHTQLDDNGLIPRTLFPDVYDQVKSIVNDLREEAQYAAWFWIEAPEGKGGMHPAFSLPANRKVYKVEAGVVGANASEAKPSWVKRHPWAPRGDGYTES